MKKEASHYEVKALQPLIPKKFKKNYWRIHILRDKLATLSIRLYSFLEDNSVNEELLREVPKGKDFIDFALEKKDAQTELYLFLRLIDRLLNDFCHYTYFGIIAINPSHIAPVYSLLRKPYLQTIPLMEWIVSNPGDFMEKFASDITLIDKYFKDELASFREKNHKNAAKLTFFPLHGLVNDLLNINHFDSSLHLVTTRKENRTENLNMNFIFLNLDATLAEQNTEFVINQNAICLAYAFSLFTTLIEIIDYSVLKNSKPLTEYLDFTHLNYELLHSYALMLAVLGEKTREISAYLKLFNVYAEALEINCSNCTKAIQLRNKEDLKMFADYEILLCKKCKKVIISNQQYDLKDLDINYEKK